MGTFTQLDVVNEMLGLLGERRVNSLDLDHPLVSSGVNFLRVANAREQGRGWWFNTEVVSLSPDIAGRIAVPSDVLQLDPSDPCLKYAQRGNALYNLAPLPGASPTVFTQAVICGLIRLVPFEDLPTVAGLFVSTSAKLDFLIALDGDDSKINNLGKQRREAQIGLNAEHIGSVDANLLYNPSLQATRGSLRGNTGGRLRTR